MKRLKNLTAILCVIFVFAALTSCMQSEAAKQADSWIAAIGTVSLDNEEEILVAEKAVENLSPEEQETLKNLPILEAARAEWDALKTDHIVSQVIQAIDAIPNIATITLESESVIVSARSTYNSMIGNDEKLKAAVNNYDVLIAAEKALLRVKANEIETAISAIGTVSLDSWDAIQDAREAYDRAPDIIQAEVKNFSVLTSAEKTLADLKIKQKVKPVEDLIDAIGNVTLESENAIAAAQDAYEGLSEDEAAMVDNISILAQAHTKLKTLKKEAVFSRMTTTTDKVSGITWYESFAQPQYVNERSFVYPYIGVNENGRPWLRMKYNYCGYDWLFWDQITVWVDGTTYTHKFTSSKYEFERDSSSKRKWEVLDTLIGYYRIPLGDDAVFYRYENRRIDAEIQELWAIVNSTETIIRFQGDNKRYDLTVSAEDKAGIKDVLLAFEYLNEYILAEIAIYD